MMLGATVLFATWFGSETILGASSEFVKHGLYGVIEDPFGAALCLLLIAIFFARPLYRMNLMTFGDFYRVKFNRFTEVTASIFMIPSYFGWVAAQLVALGIIISSLAPIGFIPAVILSAIVVTAYTFIGGMWAISLTDFIQTIIIIGGLLYLAIVLGNASGGFTAVMNENPEGFFRFLPENTLTDWSYYLAAWMTIGLGSIPQQDVFQRVMSSKSEQVAVRASYMAAFLYLSVALLPLFIALCARILNPQLLEGDEQMMLPRMVMEHTALPMQVLFFGALLSAIMSTTSGALLAPAAILSENLIKPLSSRQFTGKQRLWLVRMSVIAIAIVSTFIATISKNIYELVGESSALSLVSLFVPMMAGLYFKRAKSLGAVLSMIMGMAGWLYFEYFPINIPALIPGLAFSVLGMVVGSWLQLKLKFSIIKKISKND